MNKIILEGCSPDSLMMNLKALGIFRIISEQKDVAVRANWKQDKFVLHTKLTKENLVEFFLKEYIPTPIVSPWNNGSGFYEYKEAEIDAIKKSSEQRLKEYQKVICDVEDILKEQIPNYSKISSKDKEYIKKIKGEMKNDFKFSLQKQIRNKIDDKVISWLDATYVITSDKSDYGIVLGSGGNDGNFEISANFMDCIVKCIDAQSKYIKQGEKWIQGSLFGSNVELVGMSSAYFYPDGYKAENCSSGGFEEYSFVNPWDYILMIEGIMLFAGNVSRRSIPKAAFPFTVKSSMAGYGTSSSEKQRGEIWIPFWDNPVTFKEIKYVFNEGKAQISTRHVETGSDFARSIVNLGIQSGLSGFQRFGMLERKGRAYLASNLGQINVREKPQARLFEEIDEWLNKIRHNKNSSNSITLLINSVDNSIIKFCAHSDENRNFHYLQKILITLGKLEKNISISSKIREKISPLQNLSKEWVDACYDGTSEFRLALALASIDDEKYPIRFNLEQIKKTGNKIEWNPNTCETVWGSGSVIQNMIMVLERRCIYAQINKTPTMLLASKIPAPIKDIIKFLDGTLNYEKISDLVHPLSIISHDKEYKPEYCNIRDIWNIPELIPESYTHIKSNFPPLFKKDRDHKFEPSIISQLKANNLSLAQKIAQRRLQIIGINTWAYNNLKHLSDSSQVMSVDFTKKLTASFLFPIDRKDMENILERVRVNEDMR